MTQELPTSANLADNQRKIDAKPRDIEFKHSHMEHLCYRSLTPLKNLSNGMNLKKTAPNKLCEDCQKEDQTRQPSRKLMSESTKFLCRVHSDLERLFPWRRQSYRYYISFLEESKGLLNIQPLKFKDDVLDTFKYNIVLGEK